jgi:hypothetical protein
MAPMASKAVNRPMDVKFKDQNVNDKLQLYGIWTAFANGKVPSVCLLPWLASAC